MIITLAGLSGAGKSTVKELLARHLNWKTYSMGDMRAAYALEHHMTVDELNAADMEDGKFDKLVDAFQTELGKKEDNFIVDGWMSWHFLPQSIKIFLTIDPKEGARRIFAEQHASPDHRQDERAYADLHDVEETLEKRILQNQERYKKWYGVDFLDLGHYDLVIDTTNMSPNEVTSRILAFISSRA